MNNNVKELSILNHTHWDREWYETFEEYRYKLRNGLRYVTGLLEEDKIDHFFLDGQTIVLEDYKEVVSSEEYERFTSLIRDGKIEVGPWYLLADEFLVSGESMLKNLEMGIEIAQSLNSAHNIGYLPDTFGHISQLPQIWRGFHIDTALIFRGAVSERFENHWIGADGSSVLAFVLPLFEGYYQTFLKHDSYIQETIQYMEGNAPFLTFGKALALNGADHTFTAPDLKSRMERLRQELPGVDVKETSMAAFVEQFRDQQVEGVIRGEQRDPSKIFILPGVYSARSYLKDQNQQCEDEAVGVMEALNVWTNGATDSAEFIRYVWKLILQNHPHDSICGCSVDEVHREMETRSRKALGAMRQFAADTINSVYPFEFIDATIENKWLYLLHNNPIAGTYPVRTTIHIPAAQDLGGIALYAGDQALPFDLLKRERGEQFMRHILAEPHYGDYVSYELAFTVPFDGYETKAVRVERIAQAAEDVQKGSAELIQNEFYSVRWDKNGLAITDLESGLIYTGQHQFISSLDAGDTYNYSPPVNDVTSHATLIGCDRVQKGGTFQSVTLRYTMELPASLNDDRTGPSERLATNTIITVITLDQGSPLIRFQSRVSNAAKDQKLRVVFPVTQSDTSKSDTPFDLVERQTVRHKEWDMPRNKEAVMNQYPSYSSVFAGEHQLVHRGLQEYEVDAFGTSDAAFLTLIRGVGWLSRRDLRTRGNGAGPGFETPEAQCLGDYEFSYGLVLGQERHSLNHKLRLRQSVLSQQSYVQKEGQQLFALSSPVIAFSSVMLKEDNSFDIRMFNPSDAPHSTQLKFGFVPEAVTEVDFTGQPRCRYEADSVANIDFAPKEIKTIRIRRNGGLQ